MSDLKPLVLHDGWPERLHDADTLVINGDRPLRIGTPETEDPDANVQITASAVDKIPVNIQRKTG